MIRGLTEAEQEVIDLLADAAYSMDLLPKLHPSDLNEFTAAVHACQNIVYSRPAFENFKATTGTLYSTDVEE